MPDEHDRSDPAILHFDSDRSALIEPPMWHDRLEAMPPNAVITWMADAFEAFLAGHDHEEIYHFPVESTVLSVFRVERRSGPVAVALAQVGAPISSLLMETMIALGGERVASVGSAGGLVPEHPPGTVVVPSLAIRDEGVSYHYAEAGEPARPSPARQSALVSAMEQHGLPVSNGVVWTTDAFYRETRGKVERRVAEGAIAVDMEVAALSTVASFRGIDYGAAVYMADTLHSDQWDPTELVSRNTDYRRRLLIAAADSVSG